MLIIAAAPKTLRRMNPYFVGIAGKVRVKMAGLI
jgi:hypothetical protein